jgi:hypothetical protein
MPYTFPCKPDTPIKGSIPSLTLGNLREIPLRKGREGRLALVSLRGKGIKRSLMV